MLAATTTDPVTGLPTRAELGDLSAPGRSGQAAALLVGMDRFCQLNDTFGLRAGDEALEAIAARLRHAIGAEPTLARWGGDEFAVLCDGDAAAVGALADRMLEVLRPPFAVEERAVHLDASIGIALSEDGAESAGTLLHQATVALQRAKVEGGGRWRRFDTAMRAALQDSALEHELRIGIERGELVLFFQPVVALADRRIVGLETLVRWRHPERGLLQPAQFLPIAERSGLIVPLGRRVLADACRQLARWSNDPRLDDVRLSVNIAGRQLADPLLPEDLATALHRSGAAPDRLTLELSETVLIGQSGAPTDTLQRLLDLGIRLTLDDFGAGWTSMTHLRNLPVEALKVDRSFVAGITDDQRDRHVFGSIVQLGSGLGVDVIAAGIETEKQAECVAELGCAAAQGYWFSPPVPADDAETLLLHGLTAPRHASGVPSAPDAEPYVALRQAAEALGVSTSTLRRWADAGRVPFERTPGGHRRFAVAWLREHRAPLGGSDHVAVVRQVELPVSPLPALARLLDRDGARLLDAAVRVLYEPGHAGWFASPDAEAALDAWSGTLATTLAAGDHGAALEATVRLLRAAGGQRASVLERHAFLERHADLVIRALRQRTVDHAELVGAGRLFGRMRHAALDLAARPAEGSPAESPILPCRTVTTVQSAPDRRAPGR